MSSADERGSVTGIIFWAGGALVAAAIVVAGILIFLGRSDERSALDATPVAVSGRSASVEVADNRFVPQNLRIETGATVTWEFVGGSAHNVNAEQGAFESDTMNDGAFSHTFDAPGEYFYRCTLHPGMRGVIVVADAATSAP